MKKVLFTLIMMFSLLSIFTFACHNYQQTPTNADSGFDSDYGDYDGGGWGGSDNDYDGSWGEGEYGDEDNNNKYTNKALGSEDIPLFILILAGMVAISFGVPAAIKGIRKAIKRKDLIKNEIIDTLRGYYILQPGDGCNLT